jgi:hypothetical protein
MRERTTETTSSISSTPPPSGRWTAWLTPSRVVAIAVVGSIPAKLLALRLGDPDLWWHLRTGRLIADTHRIPHVDVYSYTAAGRRWVVQEWGSELILHGLRKAMGLYGILAYRAALVFFLYLIVSRLLVKRMGNGIGTWALLGLTAYAGSANWTERPNLLSFLLFAVTLTLLDRKDRSIWWFLPIAALWANLHGMVLLGIGLVAVVAGSEGLKVLFRWPGADRVWAKRTGLVAVGGVLAMMLNPVGPGLILHGLQLVRTVTSIVTEWQSPDFHEASAIVFMALLMLTIAALAFNPGGRDPTDVGLMLAFTVLSLQAVRNLALGAIVLGVVTARYLPDALATVRRNTTVRQEMSPSASVFMGALGIVLTLGGLAGVVVHGFPRSDRIADIVEKRYPVEAIDAINKPGVRLFTFDVWSGMVIDRDWPNVRVFIDLRQDVYGLAQARKYQHTISAFPEWRQDLDSVCTTHVLIRPKDALTQVLSLDRDWTLVRKVGNSVTFQRRAPAPGCERYPIPSV